MRKSRLIEQNRCYHLVSRLAHRAFFLDDEEKDRAVALMRRVEDFSGVVVLAYAFMYGGGGWRAVRECHEKSMREAMGEVQKAREAEKEGGRAGRGAAPVRSKADQRLDMPDKVGIGLARGSERTAKRILELLAGGSMRPSALREAVGIRSPIHFSRYYLTPLMEKGMIERTDPDSPKSPRQEYRLA